MFSKTIAFHTLGCKLNFAETSTISRKMTEAGFEKTDFENSADVYVINTCSVTENADKECRKIVKQVRKRNANAHVVIIGCYAQLKPKEISEIDGVSMVLGAKEKFRLPEYLSLLMNVTRSEKAVVHSCEIEDVKTFESSYSFGERTRAFLKVQDGCNYPCTYCTIPLARGSSRSDKVEHVVQQAKLLSELGVKEIVLTGINLGDFGIQNGKREETFFDLVKALDGLEGIDRYRISSIEPNLLSDEIIKFVSESNHFMPHFHVPLQSGSNKILKSMKRRYARELFAEKIFRIKEAMPLACIGADVITGFPDETETDFLDTYNFINELPLSYLHVFTYSERQNTVAAEMKNKIPLVIRQERNHQLRILSEKKRNSFYHQNMNQSRPVLFETESNDGMMEGFTDNYIKVRSTYVDSFSKSIVNVSLVNLTDDFYLTNLNQNQKLSETLVSNTLHVS